MILIADPDLYPGWNEMVLRTGAYSFFHSQEWARVLKYTYGYTPAYCVLMREGRISAMLPFMEIRSALTGTRGVSLPFSDYCSPITESDADLNRLIEFCSRYGRERGWKTMEMRVCGDHLQDEETSSTYFRHVLDITPSDEELERKLTSSTKRNIRKSIRHGLKAELSTTKKAMDEFYRLHCMTRKTKGLPPQPRSFFAELLKQVIEPGKGIVVAATYQDKCIAAAICVHFGRIALFKYGASDRRYLGMRPNNLVLWEAIQWYRKMGVRNFCFGRTDIGDEGLVRFKSGWGAEAEIIRYFTYDMLRREYRGKKGYPLGISEKIFRTMPMPMLRAAGALLYRHVG